MNLKAVFRLSGNGSESKNNRLLIKDGHQRNCSLSHSTFAFARCLSKQLKTFTFNTKSGSISVFAEQTNLRSRSWQKRLFVSDIFSATNLVLSLRPRFGRHSLKTRSEKYEVLLILKSISIKLLTAKLIIFSKFYCNFALDFYLLVWTKLRHRAWLG